MTLKLRARGDRKDVAVANIAEASREFQKWRDANDYGASDMRPGSGDVVCGARTVAKVSYNGRVWGPGAWTPESKPLAEATQ